MKKRDSKAEDSGNLSYQNNKTFKDGIMCFPDDRVIVEETLAVCTYLVVIEKDV